MIYNPLRSFTASGKNHPTQTARYARLTAQSAGLTLYEVGFLDESGHPLPIAGVSQSGQTADSSSSAALTGRLPSSERSREKISS